MSADPHSFLERIWPLCRGRAAFSAQLGEGTLAVECPGPDWLGPLSEAFWSVSDEAPDVAGLQVRVVDLNGVRRLPALPVQLQQQASRGRIEPWCTKEFLAVGSPWGLTFADRRAGRAVLYVQALEGLPTWERCAPLRNALGFLAPALGYHLLHGAAVSCAGGAFLLVGQGGSGKSSSALAALVTDGPLGFLSEDYTLVRIDGDAAVYPLYRSFKIDAPGLARMPGLERYRQLGRQGEKSCRLLPRHLLSPAFPLRAIVWPDRTQERLLSPVSKGTALLKLAPSTLFQNPNAAGSDLHALAELCRRFDSYRLGLASEPPAELVAQQLAQLSTPEASRCR